MQVVVIQKHSSLQDSVDHISWELVPALHGLKWKFIFIGSSGDCIKAVSKKYPHKLEVGKKKAKVK